VVDAAYRAMETRAAQPLDARLLDHTAPPFGAAAARGQAPVVDG